MCGVSLAAGQLRERAQYIAAADLADDPVLFQYRLSTQSGFHEEFREIDDAHTAVDRLDVSYHQLRDRSAWATVIARGEHDLHAVEFGQHTDKIAVVIEDRCARYAVMNQLMDSIEYVGVRCEGDELAGHVVFDERGFERLLHS